MYGELFLVVPRLTPKSAHVVILSREGSTTTYKITMQSNNVTGVFKISTRNKWVLADGVRLDVDDKKKMRAFACSRVSVACLVAGPSSDPARWMVNHCNGDTQDDTDENLHWVIPAFNSFNKEPLRNGPYKGVHPRGKPGNCLVRFKGQAHGTYAPETAAWVWDLLV